MTTDKIGRYEIVHEIARGGMAVVYLAKDSFIQRHVAVKVLPQVFMHDPQFERRFTREARVVASLEHPAIVPVYDFGYHGEQPYMVYRYMRGGTLKEKIQREGAKSIPETFGLLSRLAPAIDRAHEKGIIHRDLKPSNILFDEDDEAYIADFGIAKIVESTSHLTGNAIVGTPAYMSPEQFTGDSEVGRYSDIYALGIILYELLSGELPFKADTTPRLMKLHIMDPVPSIRSIRSELPQDIDAILEKCLAKSTADRYQRVEELNADFEQVIRRKPAPEEGPQETLLEEDATILEPEAPIARVESVAESVTAVDLELLGKPDADGLSSKGPSLEEGLAGTIETMTGEALSRIVTVLQTSFSSRWENMEWSLGKEHAAVLLISLGWGLGYAIGKYVMSTDPLILPTVYFMIAGTAGGLTLALTSKWILPSLPWTRTLIIAGVWFAAWTVVWPLAESQNIGSPWQLAFIALLSALSGLAGTVTGLSIFWEEKERRWGSIGTLLFGWVSAVILSTMLLAYIESENWLQYYYLLDQSIDLGSVLAFAILGFIGGSITLRQLKKASVPSMRPREKDFSHALVYLIENDPAVLVLLLLSWFLAEILAQIALDFMNGDTSLIYFIYGGLGAFITALGIKKLKPNFGWVHLSILVAAWMVLWEGRWHLGNVLGIAPGLNAGWYLIQLLAAGLAGTVMGILLRQVSPQIQWKNILRIALSWMMGWGISGLIAGYFHSVDHWIIHWETPVATFSYFWILTSPLIGFIGGVTTVSEVIQPEGTASSEVIQAR